jgi:hypothetical protein
MSSQVPDTAAYLLISVFPQLPITIFLGYLQEILFPVDYIIASMMLAFLVRNINSSSMFSVCWDFLSQPLKVLLLVLPLLSDTDDNLNV